MGFNLLFPQKSLFVVEAADNRIDVELSLKTGLNMAEIYKPLIQLSFIYKVQYHDVPLSLDPHSGKDKTPPKKAFHKQGKNKMVETSG